MSVALAPAPSINAGAVDEIISEPATATAAAKPSRVRFPARSKSDDGSFSLSDVHPIMSGAQPACKGDSLRVELLPKDAIWVGGKIGQKRGNIPSSLILKPTSLSLSVGRRKCAGRRTADAANLADGEPA